MPIELGRLKHVPTDADFRNTVAKSEPERQAVLECWEDMMKLGMGE